MFSPLRSIDVFIGALTLPPLASLLLENFFQINIQRFSTPFMSSFREEGGSDFPTDSPAHQYALRTGPTCGSRLEAGATRRWKINHVHFAIHSNHIVTDGRMARTATKPTHSCGGVSWPIHGKPVGVGIGVRAWPNSARAYRLFIFNQQTAKGVNADQTNKVIRFFAATSMKFLLVWHPSSSHMHYAKGYCVIGAKIGVVLLWNLTICLNFSLQK